MEALHSSDLALFEAFRSEPAAKPDPRGVDAGARLATWTPTCCLVLRTCPPARAVAVIGLDIGASSVLGHRRGGRSGRPPAGVEMWMAVVVRDRLIAHRARDAATALSYDLMSAAYQSLAHATPAGSRRLTRDCTWPSVKTG